MQTKNVNVLNTVTVNGTDCAIDANGIVNLAGVTFPASAIVSIGKQSAVAETKAVWTITPTYVAAADYKIVIQGYHKSTGTQFIAPITVNAADAPTADATGICDLWRAAIALLTDLNVVASGTSTLVLTASGVNAAGFDQLADFAVTENSANITAVNTTAGVAAQGTVDVLKRNYPQLNAATNLGYAGTNRLVSGKVYTEYDVVVNIPSSGGAGQKSPVMQNEYVFLVDESATNFSDLCGTYGTLTGLVSGQKVTIDPVTTVANKAAAITVTTGVITLSGSDAPTFASEGILANDVINISSTYSRVQGVLTQTTAVGTTTAAVSASAYRVVRYRPIPF